MSERVRRLEEADVIQGYTAKIKSAGSRSSALRPLRTPTRQRLGTRRSLVIWRLSTYTRLKRHLSRLLERVEAGEEIIIARNGKAVAKLVRLKRRRRRPGSLKGKIRIHADFDSPLPESIAAAFRGESD